MNEENFKQTDWNMAMAYFIRIDKILSLSADAALREDGHSWYKYLLALIREVDHKLTDPERTDLEEQLPKIVDAITKLRKGRIMASELYNLLHTLDKQLRRVMEKHQMLIPNKDAVTHGFG